ncbi:unnamed protein product [Toxocara canis]|uniref:Uncharacterized protein n=1 Tax=Toxocara canis TaxID=6265 RepID=A0A183V4T8_TOXCA|nr:unnamed protein product [Toxocara canis]
MADEKRWAASEAQVPLLAVGRRPGAIRALVAAGQMPRVIGQCLSRLGEAPRSGSVPASCQYSDWQEFTMHINQ